MRTREPETTSPKAQFNPAPLDLARKRRSWAFARVASLAGLTPCAVSRTLSGKCSRVTTVAALCEVLGVDPAECWLEAPAPAPEKQSTRRPACRQAGADRQSAAGEIRFDPTPLQYQRVCRGLTYEELAKRVGLTMCTVYNTLAGGRKSVRTVAKLCQFLKVDPTTCWLKGGTPAEDASQSEIGNRKLEIEAGGRP